MELLRRILDDQPALEELFIDLESEAVGLIEGIPAPRNVTELRAQIAAFLFGDPVYVEVDVPKEKSRLESRLDTVDSHVRSMFALADRMEGWQDKAPLWREYEQDWIVRDAATIYGLSAGLTLTANQMYEDAALSIGAMGYGLYNLLTGAPDRPEIPDIDNPPDPSRPFVDEGRSQSIEVGQFAAALIPIGVGSYVLKRSPKARATVGNTLKVGGATLKALAIPTIASLSVGWGIWRTRRAETRLAGKISEAQAPAGGITPEGSATLQTIETGSALTTGTLAGLTLAGVSVPGIMAAKDAELDFGGLDMAKYEEALWGYTDGGGPHDASSDKVQTRVSEESADAAKEVPPPQVTNIYNHYTTGTGGKVAPFIAPVYHGSGGGNGPDGSWKDAYGEFLASLSGELTVMGDQNVVTIGANNNVLINNGSADGVKTHAPSDTGDEGGSTNVVTVVESEPDAKKDTSPDTKTTTSTSTKRKKKKQESAYSKSIYQTLGSSDDGYADEG